MTNRPRPALVHYYVDAGLLGVAKILVQLRGDVTYPGDPGGAVKGGRMRAPCTITGPATLDAVWIPETARQEWLIVTRDRRIQEHRYAPLGTLAARRRRPYGVKLSRPAQIADYFCLPRGVARLGNCAQTL